MSKSFSLYLLLLLLCCSYASTGGSSRREPSTPEERRLFVDIVRQIEHSPLDKSLQKKREKAFLWLIDIPDVTVHICTAPLGDFFDNDKNKKDAYKYTTEIFAQLVLSQGVFVIENGETSNNDAEYIAGVEGALNAYRAILRTEPDARSTILDELLEKQSLGDLVQVIQENSKKCHK